MLIQVVHCHPLPDSYNHALFRTIVWSLEKNRHEVVATDLYHDQFDPVMSAAERRSYYEAHYADAAVLAEIALLRRVEGEKSIPLGRFAHILSGINTNIVSFQRKMTKKDRSLLGSWVQNRCPVVL